MKLSTLFLILLCLASSCENEENPSNEFRVVIENTADISCSLPIIRFLDKESEVKRRTNRETLTYNAYSLDDTLNVLGNTLVIEFTTLEDEDFRPCLDIGISYPGIKTLSARLAN